MLYIFKGCVKCCGDLAQDGDEWRCFQCGRVFYPKRPPIEPQFDRVAVEDTMPAASGRERTVIRRSARHLNPLMGTTSSNEELWWAKNKTVIYHLDQGKKVREVAEIVGQGPRQIRVVRERLRDLRTSELELVGAD